MSFKFAARTILELGQELISSDEVALSELIKNAVDAKSPRVAIAVNIQLRNSDYRAAVARITEEDQNRCEVLDFIRSVLTDSDNDVSTALLADLRKLTADK